MATLFEINGGDITIGAEGNGDDAVASIHVATLDGPVGIQVSLEMASKLGAALQELSDDVIDSQKLWNS
jgi:hypothetical protein